jgi:CBS domain containing-hemolysin-like protein
MLGLVFALALVVLNGFFVAAEFSFVRVRPSRLERLAKRGNKRAAAAAKIAHDLERYLSVSQIGVTLCSLALGWIGEPAIEQLVDGVFFSISQHHLGPTAHGFGVGIAFGLLTFFHVLIGEQAPKLIALHRAEALALALAAPFRIVYTVLTPVRVVLQAATTVVLRLVGVRGPVATEGKLTEEELTAVIAATMARGPAAEDKRQLLERVVRFASRQARHAMVPRVDVASLPVHTSGKDAIEYLRHQGFSRVVLTETHDLDRVVGYLYAKDLLFDDNAPSLTDLTTVRRDLLFVPEPQSLIDTLRAMQEAQTLFAVVVDEYGGTSGIITMEDLLEEIVGDIRDEADEEAPPPMQPVAGQPGAWDVEAATSLDELRAIGIEPSSSGGGEGGEPIGAVVVRALGRLPRFGDRVRLGPFDAEVRGVRRRRIEKLRLHPRAPTTRPPPNDEPS